MVHTLDQSVGQTMKVLEEARFFRAFNYFYLVKTFETSPYLWYNDEALFETGKNNKDMVVYRYVKCC